MSPSDLWRFFPFGYLFTILIETLILLVGLSQKHSIKRRLVAGVWLTACTYPIVVLVMPLLFASSSRTVYLAVAETFAPAAECLLFATIVEKWTWRDMAVIVAANLASFAAGEILFRL